ncbi:MAG: hypothetical protein ABRQ38_01780 [Candidatus Eremiobacterota bacterium]
MDSYNIDRIDYNDNFIIFRGFETMSIESFYEVRTIINKEVFRFL